MSIYSELADLVHNVEAANNAIVEAGGITFKGPYRADIMAIIAAEASSGYLVARCIDGGA